MVQVRNDTATGTIAFYLMFQELTVNRQDMC